MRLFFLFSSFFAALFLLAAFPAAAAAPADISDMNVIIVLIDTLQADHLGCYGYSRNTSPNIDALASESVVFEKAFSCTAFTSESMASIFNGWLPSMSGLGSGWLAMPTPAVDTIGDFFQKAGYATGIFTITAALYDPLFNKGFTEQDHLIKNWPSSNLDEQLSLRALEFAQKHISEKFMAHVHYYDPHGPYTPSNAYYLRLADHVYPNPVDLGTVGDHLLDYLATGFGPGEERFEDLKLRYDAEIREVDDAFGVLIKGLKDLGLFENTLIIVTADHGEEFLGHGLLEHCMQIYEDNIQVPLMFHAPAFLTPARISNRVGNISILPTLLELTRIPDTRGDFNGEPLFRYGLGGIEFAPPTKPLIAEMLLEDRSLLRAFTSGNWRYIAAQRHFDQAQAVQASLLLDQSLRQLRQGLLPTIDNWGPVVHEELYNLATDPNEHQSVVDQNPAQMAIMRQLYTDYKAVVDATPKTLIPPQLRAPLPPEQPQLFTITPAAGPTSGGNSVVLTGKLLSGATRVMFGNTQTTNFTVNSSGNQLTVVAPAHTLSTVDVWGHVNVRVWGSGWYSYPLIYDYTSPPVAAFTASTVTGRAPLRVQFTDTSSAMSAPITEWHWSFGDGWLSDQQNPVHYYVMAGVYTVTLTVKNADGTNTAASPTLVHVDPCFIDFLVVPSSGPGPLAVQFVDESTPDSPITSWDWNFGDGTRSNEQNPAHVFTERGAYTVELTVTTANGTYTFGKTWCVDIGNALPAQTALALLLLIGILAATGLVRIVLRNGG